MSHAHSAHCVARTYTIAIAWRFAARNISFVVAEKDMQTALAAAHREFRLGTLTSQALAEEKLADQSRGLVYGSERFSATTD